MKYFISDLHLGHRSMITKGGRNFKDINKMNDYILYNVFKNVNKGDDFYHAGDLAWDTDSLLKIIEIIRKKKFKFHLILGNHDKVAKQYYNFFESVSNIKDIKINKYPITICHYPMFTWNKSHYNAGLLFGHHHTSTYGFKQIREFELNGKKININCEFNNYEAYTENEILEILKNRPNNWDLIKEKERCIKEKK